jgi:hypothetical protein
MFKIVHIKWTFLFYILYSSVVIGDVRWVPMKDGDTLPQDAILVGEEKCGPNDGKKLYVCRANYNGGVHPGKWIAGRCNISYGGNEYPISNYEVAAGTGVWGKPKPNYQDALIGGQEPNRTLYVCRVHFLGDICPFFCCSDHGYHSGKVVAGKCNFGFEGAEDDTHTDFEVFYASNPPQTPPVMQEPDQNCNIPPKPYSCPQAGVSGTDMGTGKNCDKGYRAVCVEYTCQNNTFTKSYSFCDKK